MPETARYANWPSDIDEDAFRKDSYNLTNRQLSAKYDRAYRNIQRLKRFLEDQGKAIGHAGFVVPERRIWNEYLQLKLDRFIVMADCHIPEHSPEMFVNIVDIAKHWGINHLLINGDLVSMNALSPHKRSSPLSENYADMANLAQETIERFLDSFSEVYYLRANHERWLDYSTNGQVSFGREFVKIPHCTFSQYPYAFVESAGEKILIGHPKAMSKLQAGVPRMLSRRYHCHIISGHTHFLNFTWSEAEEEYWLVEGGHCLSEEYVEYKQTNLTTYGKWNAGFVMVIDGWPHLICPRNVHQYMQMRVPENEQDIRHIEDDKSSGHPVQYSGISGL